jgi:hypothetical protein
VGEITTAETASDGSWSVIACQLAPASGERHSPPLAEPTQRICESVGSNACARIRPATLSGPRLRHCGSVSAPATRVLDFASSVS